MRKRKITFEEAKNRYLQRFTMEHVPQWALFPVEPGIYYAPQYATDLEWYENTFFNGEHELASKEYCYTTKQTWPLGHWLDKPYGKG